MKKYFAIFSKMMMAKHFQKFMFAFKIYVTASNQNQPFLQGWLGKTGKGT